MLKSASGAIFGPPSKPQLPERIKNAIAAQQDQSEILIAWFQLVVVCFFMVLYTLAPKTAVGTPFMPVPYVLAAFFLFAAIRVFLAHHRLMPMWFVLVSIVIDVSLLMGLIWSFHVQYGQPAAFYLKAPTMLYVFIFIALRALRFDPTYVIVTGLTAALGWLVLVGYAIDADAGRSITRDYVAYLTSNRVLIGAEVDKVIAILVVTAVLSVALIRARRLLMRSVADAALARDLTRFVPPEVASRITSAERDIAPGDGEVKTASVLFCDIEGFSTFSETLSPDQLMRTLNEYFAALAAIIDRNGGLINQFQGDAILVTFNTVRADPAHAAAAVQTALEIQAQVRERTFGPGLTLKTRCGINTGDLIAGAIGTTDRLIYTVYGDEVNIAARLEQLNKRYGTYVLATEQTVSAAGAGLSARPIGSVTVRGRSAPVTVFAVEQASDDARMPSSVRGALHNPQTSS
jgi:adenylate cyclase